MHIFSQKKLCCLVWIFLILLIGLCGCTGYYGASSGKTPDDSSENHSVVVKETLGKTMVLPHTVSRIVTQNGDAVELLIAIGAQDTIVGVSETVKARPEFTESLKDLPSIGDWQTPNVEKIVLLDPDILITYGTMVKNVDQIQAANITMLRLDCYRIPDLASDARSLGNLTGKTQKAEEYAEFVEYYLDLVQSRISHSPHSPLHVYIEGYSDYAAHSKESGGNQLTSLLNVTNIAGDLPGISQKVSPEWIIKQNPDVILKIASSEDMHTQSLEEIRAGIMNRPGFDRMKAVENGRVYVLNGDIISSPRGVAGVVYTAKALYPDLFRDIDPNQILKEYSDRFFSGADNMTTIAPAFVKEKRNV